MIGDQEKAEEVLEKATAKDPVSLLINSPLVFVMGLHGIEYLIVFILAENLINFRVAIFQSNPKLLLQLIDLAYTKNPVDEAEMMGYFERGIKSTLAIEHRVAFSQRKMEFLEDFSPSVAKYVTS